jgi:hypothetical protein
MLVGQGTAAAVAEPPEDVRTPAPSVSLSPEAQVRTRSSSLGETQDVCTAQCLIKAERSLALCLATVAQLQNSEGLSPDTCRRAASSGESLCRKTCLPPSEPSGTPQPDLALAQQDT